MKTSLQESGRILVVDDQPWFLEPLATALTDCGYEVAIARDGNEALAKLNTFLPDLILMDVMMPGMDGFEACAAIKDNPRHQDIPVILMSADADQSSILSGFEIGAADYLCKPFNKPEMLARVRVQMHAHRARAFHHDMVEDQVSALAASLNEWLSAAHFIALKLGKIAAHPAVKSEATLEDAATDLAREVDGLVKRLESFGATKGHPRKQVATVHALQWETPASTLESIVGSWYLRARRMGLSLTLATRPPECVADASPADVRQVLDRAISRFLRTQAPGNRCEAMIRAEENGEISVRLGTVSTHAGNQSSSQPDAAAATAQISRSSSEKVGKLSARIDEGSLAEDAFVRVTLPAKTRGS